MQSASVFLEGSEQIPGTPYSSRFTNFHVCLDASHSSFVVLDGSEHEAFVQTLSCLSLSSVQQKATC